MARARTRFDILIVGDHPCTWLCASIVAQSSEARVAVLAPAKPPNLDRPVLVNPALFQLHKSISALRSKVGAADAFGLEILSSQPDRSAEYRSDKPCVLVAGYADLQAAMKKSAQASGVEIVKFREFGVEEVDGANIDCRVDGKSVSAGLIAYAQSPRGADCRIHGFTDRASPPTVQYAWHAVPGKLLPVKDPKPLVTMSLELQGVMQWAWLLRQGEAAIVSVELPGNTSDAAAIARIQAWCDVLGQRGRLTGAMKLEPRSLQSMLISAGGALSTETVGNRALLFGPAGGFFSAGCEDIYPNCWSAVCAAETLSSALTARHAQDELQNYRARWGATLGDYLRGPQQNLKFLLPLVYRNKMMAARIAEAILNGSSVVR